MIAVIRIRACNSLLATQTKKKRQQNKQRALDSDCNLRENAIDWELVQKRGCEPPRLVSTNTILIATNGTAYATESAISRKARINGSLCVCW